MRAAQDSVLERCYGSFGELTKQVLDDLKLNVVVPPSWMELSVDVTKRLPYKDLYNKCIELQQTSKLPDHAIATTLTAVCDRLQLLTAFSEPDSVIQLIEQKVEGKVASLPKKASDIERGRNPGDVIDPYILAAAQYLLYAGSFDKTISAAVSHKALMILEDLVGHLHEDVIGWMRGNVRIPEPRGKDQEKLDMQANPFPGADLMQPPSEGRSIPRFHQVKNKTGSAKGGDGKRLGLQLQLLQDTYGGEIFYTALIGNTLKGHRSKAGVLAVAPSVAVLVGAASFEELTGCTIGPQLLLKVYRSAFMDMARKSGYDIEEVSSQIVGVFSSRSNGTSSGGFLESLLIETISGPRGQQDTRY